MSTQKAYVDFCSQAFPGEPVPPIEGEIPMKYEVAIRTNDPALWQQMKGNEGQGSSPLPEDTRLRMQQGIFLPSDAEHYRNSDLDWYASQCDAEGEGIRELKRERQFLAEKEAFEQVRAQSKAFGELPLAARLQASPVSEATARAARRAWGISEPL